MSLQQAAPAANWPTFSTDKALKTPLGAASPLWAAYMGLAGAGVAYWWMTRWMRPTNLEALFGRPAPIAATPVVVELAPVVEPVEPAPVVELAAPAPEVVEKAAEALPAPAQEAVAEVPPEPSAPAVVAKPKPKAEPEGLSPQAKALIAKRKAATSGKSAKTA